MNDSDNDIDKGEEVPAPFMPEAPAFKIRTKGDNDDFFVVRCGPSEGKGACWLLDRETLDLLKGKTPEEVRALLSLPTTYSNGTPRPLPTHVERVWVRKGESLFTGQIAAAHGGKEGLRIYLYTGSEKGLRVLKVVDGIIKTGGRKWF